ncbi:MAG: BlaI/MecI/CopY family transcriptional regulator [Eubacteriales bacterium]|nr:BlaI/MecI/CopY family transcriptional regulator [Eubacteriales bacterium]
MRNKGFELTKGEEVMMEIFWDAERPLTTMEISEMTDEFNDSYIHRLVKSLEKKEMLKISGLVKSGKQYARQFAPTTTREEYGAFVMQNLGIRDEKALAKVAVAMVSRFVDDENNKNEALVKELENIVEELKKG